MPANLSLPLVLCADDYALTPAVSAGILEALSAGRLSATSVMTTRPNWPAAAPALRRFDGRADIGLHLDLTLGPAKGRMPHFAPTGNFAPIGKLLVRSLRGHFAEPDAQREVRQEIGRQLDAFEAEFGRPPDYLDGHQHVHALPGIRDAVLAECAARHLASRLWLRDPADRSTAIIRRAVEVPKALLITRLSMGFAAAARSHGFAVNQGFAGFSSFNAARDFGRDFARYLMAPGPTHLVMCHPGHVDDELRGLDPAQHSRFNELRFLLSPQFLEILDRKGMTLTRFVGPDTYA